MSVFAESAGRPTYLQHVAGRHGIMTREAIHGVPLSKLLFPHRNHAGLVLWAIGIGRHGLLRSSEDSQRAEVPWAAKPVGTRSLRGCNICE